MRTDRYRLTSYTLAAPEGTRYQLPSTGRYELYDYKTDPSGNINIATYPKNKALLNILITQMENKWKARLGEQ